MWQPDQAQTVQPLHNFLGDSQGSRSLSSFRTVTPGLCRLVKDKDAADRQTDSWACGEAAFPQVSLLELSLRLTQL